MSEPTTVSLVHLGCARNRIDSELMLARMAEGQAIARIKVGAGKDGKFKYSVK